MVKKDYLVIKEKDIIKKMKFITKGKIINTVDNKISYTKVYKYKSKYYLVTSIRYNGFIVLTYPYDKKRRKI